MTYAEIISSPRHWDRQTYPLIARIKIDAGNLHQFERLIDTQTQTRVLRHDLAAAGSIVVHVACTSEAVKSRLEGRWA